MRLPFLLASALALAACTSHDSTTAGLAGHPASRSLAQGAAPAMRSVAHAIASLPDRGHLLDYAGGQPIHRSAYTLHPVALSEAHALRAIATGTLELTAPDGTPLRMRYARHIEHKDGNWTWIGRPDGAQPGTEAIITFGEKAVFGSIPNGDKPALRITTARGHAYLVETDGRALARMAAAGKLPQGPDVVALPPALAGARDKALQQAAATPQKLTASGAVPESATIDVVIGYTNAFASRLGGTSAANTRLTYLVDVANAAFDNSQVVAKLRLVSTIALNYPDNTDNEVALHELTGSDGTNDVPVPASLQPLVNERAAKHADLMSMVRVFTNPENKSCGIAWMLGSARSPILNSDSYAAVSMISDSSGDLLPDDGYYCRDETFVHEIGHNMGSAHDRTTAAGDDGVLDEGDFGAFDYSFGYKNARFFTIMAYRDPDASPPQAGYRSFSNPRSTYCGEPCGTADNDNARSLGQTAPTIAGFYPSLANKAALRSDFNGDGKSDILWRHASTGADSYWPAANAATAKTLTRVADLNWGVAGTGDFNGDGFVDVLWRNKATGANSIWRSANAATPQAVASVTGAWIIAGVDDFDGDGTADILWRNTSTGANSIWRAGNLSNAQALTTVASQAWKIVGTGDFDGDGAGDILWRNTSTGANSIWPKGNAGAARVLTALADQTWVVVGVGDFDGDGRADILWRNTRTGANSIWKAGTTMQQIGTVADQGWQVVGDGDYDGDGRDDILWRHSATGNNSIWKAADITRVQALTRVADLAWKVAG